MQKKQIHIEWSLLKRSLSQPLQKEEEEILQQWLNQHDDHKKYYTKLQQFNFSTPKIASADEQFSKLMAGIAPAKKLNISLLFRIAASIVVLLSIAVVALYLNSKNEQVNTYLTSLPIEPAKGKAILYTEEGTFIELDNKHQKTLDLGHVIASQQFNTLQYDSVTTETKPVIHRIKVPRGGEFTLHLADGTIIQLNSDSEISYPVPFGDDMRSVTLTGEAYFIVKTNKHIPFTVNCPQNITVTVLGTKFNIQAYPDDNRLLTTLTEGSIVISDSTCSRLLEPQQQAICTSGKVISVKTVDANRIIAWTNGRFVFEEESLQSIMERLERWYDVKVIFEDPSLKNVHFTGNISRYQNIDQILDKIYKLDEVYFVVDKKEVLVKKRIKS